jgi:N-acetylmuramoyl-L-alanine amidase
MIICSCYDDETCIERVRAIQYFHQHDRGWVDIGYHFLVGENGKVYEGRGWDRQGAHSPGWNNDAYGINYYLLFRLLNFYFKVFVSLVILQ